MRITVKYEDFVIIKPKLGTAKKIEQVLGTVEFIVEERIVGQAPPIKVKDLSTNPYCSSYNPSDLIPITVEQCVEIARLAQQSEKEAFNLINKIVSEFKDEVALPGTPEVHYQDGERMSVVEITEEGEKPSEKTPIVPEAGPCITVVPPKPKEAVNSGAAVVDMDLVVPKAPVKIKQEAEKYGFTLSDSEKPQKKKQTNRWPESGYSEAYLHTLENGMRIMLYSRFGAQKEDVTIVNFVILRGNYPHWNCHLNYSTKPDSEVYVSTTCFTTDEEKVILEKAVTQLYNEGRVVKVSSSEEARLALSSYMRSRA